MPKVTENSKEKNALYWKQEHNRLHKRADKDADKLDVLYRAKLKKIEKQLESFYYKYAKDNKITMKEAKAVLTPKEFRAFNIKLREWIKSGKYSDDKAFVSTMQRLKNTSKIDRYQRLQTEIKANLSELKKVQKGESETSLTNTYRETESATQNVVDVQFKQTSETKVRVLLNSEFQERRFSSRIWTQRSNLSTKINKTLTENFLEGKNFNELKSDLKSSFGASDYEARRLLITETTRINSVAKQNSFSEAGFSHYQYISVNDDRTSDICIEHDDKIFKLDEMQVGFNAPPLHVYCRSTTAPYESLDDEEIQQPPKN